MTPIDWAKRPLQKYAEFSGRANRPEYWWFFLLQLVALVVSMFIDSALGLNLGGTKYGVVYLLVGLALLLPSIAVGIRRLHDTDRSGWWLLIGLIPLIGAIVLLIFFASEGTPGENRFGPPTAAA